MLKLKFETSNCYLYRYLFRSISFSCRNSVIHNSTIFGMLQIKSTNWSIAETWKRTLAATRCSNNEHFLRLNNVYFVYDQRVALYAAYERTLAQFLIGNFYNMFVSMMRLCAYRLCVRVCCAADHTALYLLRRTLSLTWHSTLYYGSRFFLGSYACTFFLFNLI